MPPMHGAVTLETLLDRVLAACRRPHGGGAVFAVAYTLIATERVHRVTTALGGAAVIGATDADHAFSAEAGIDWNVIFQLLGMMLIVAALKRTGVFEDVAIRSVNVPRHRPFRVLAILVVVTALASAVLDNGPAR